METITFNGMDLECIKHDGKVFVSLRRACENIGIGYSSQRKKLKGCEWTNVRNIKSFGVDGRSREMTMIDLPTVATWVASLGRVLSESQISGILEELKVHGVETYFIASSKEANFLCSLEQALQPFNITFQRQYKVGTYLIDAYIESLNIAIEYDENGHDHYSHDAHKGRQNKIEDMIGCRFIRVTDRETDAYNIGMVIKQLI